MAFLIFSIVETGLKLKCFSRSSWGSRLAPENKATSGSVVKRPLWIRCNLSLGLRAEAEDFGLSAELRSLVAPLKGGLADFGNVGTYVFFVFKILRSQIYKT